MIDRNRPGEGQFIASPFGEAHDYFIENVQPRNIQACRRTVHNPSSMIHNRDQTFLLIRRGTGTLTVNGLNYPLRPGTLVNLSPFHIYRYIPEEGQTLEVVESRMNSGTYMYLVSNPYFRMQNFIVPSEPPIVYLKGMMKDIAYAAMDGLLAEFGKDSWDADSLCFCYMTELFGIITDEMIKNRGKNGKGAQKEDEASTGGASGQSAAE